MLLNNVVGCSKSTNVDHLRMTSCSKNAECPRIYRKSILKQIQYRFAVNFETLSMALRFSMFRVSNLLSFKYIFSIFIAFYLIYFVTHQKIGPKFHVLCANEIFGNPQKFLPYSLPPPPPPLELNCHQIFIFSLNFFFFNSPPPLNCSKQELNMFKRPNQSIDLSVK